MSTCDAWTSDGWPRWTGTSAVCVAVALAATWLAPVWLPAQERNLLAARNGARVIKYTSETRRHVARREADRRACDARRLGLC